MQIQDSSKVHDQSLHFSFPVRDWMPVVLENLSDNLDIVDKTIREILEEDTGKILLLRSREEVSK